MNVSLHASSLCSFILCVWVLACLYYVHICVMYVWCPQRPEEGAGSLGTGVQMVRSHYMGPLEEQPVLLIAEPSFQPLLPPF